MKKRLIGLLLTITLGLSSSISAFAEDEEKMNIYDLAEMTDCAEQEIEHASDFKQYNRLRDLSEEELSSKGFSEEDIEYIKETSYEDLVYERAQLPYNTLKGFGYSDEEIEILKEYNGEPLTEDSAVVLATSAECTGTVTEEGVSGTGNSKTVTLEYNWSWNKCPLFVKGGDGVGLAWTAGDESGTIKFSEVKSSSGRVTYVCDDSTTKIRKYLTMDDDSDTISTGICSEVEMSFISSAEDAMFWAKSGYIRAKVTPGGNYEIGTIRYVAKYGHLTTKINVAISIQFSPMPIGFSFDPEDAFEETGRDKGMIYV